MSRYKLICGINFNDKFFDIFSLILIARTGSICSFLFINLDKFSILKSLDTMNISTDFKSLEATTLEQETMESNTEI